MMSATMFVFIGYLLFVAFTPFPFNVGFFLILVLFALFVDLFNLVIEVSNRWVRDGNS